MRTVYYNASVYTGQLPLSESFAVEDGRFVFVGSDIEAKAFAREEDVKVDLGGHFVCCGFNDSHMHLLNFGQSLMTAQLASHSHALGEMLDYLRAFSAENPRKEGAWLTGRGWNQDYFSDTNRMPNRYDLDTVSTDRPILLVRCCGHGMVVNSKALEVCGISADTISPEGGRIGMLNGEPNGLFFDNAMELIYSKVPSPDREELKAMIRTACKALNSFGVTSSQTDDYCVFRYLPWQEIMKAYLELEQAGELSVRVYEQSNFTSIEALRAYAEAGYNTGWGSHMYRHGPLKMLGDGALGTRTAFLSRPYADAPDTCGFPVFTQEQMNEMVSYANSIGMQVSLHAIGDGCLDYVLNAVESALREHPRADHRHGVIHCQISRPEQLQRLIDLNMHIYMQSIFLDYDNHIIHERVGSELEKSSYAWKTLKNGGLSVSNGTDCPVELPDPMACIQCAVTRSSLNDNAEPYRSEEAFTVQEAIDSYTIRGAESSFEEDFKGYIRPGYAADFVVLDKNPFLVSPDRIKDVKVIETYLGGEKVYRR